MHVIFRESHGLEETETPIDLGQSPADLVVLSFSDSDLGAFAAGWHAANGALPTLRLANLAALRHPLSVDTYIETTLARAKGILVRLIGGASYWHYGLVQVEQLARENGIALAVLAADGREDPSLIACSTVTEPTLRKLANLCNMGGVEAAQAALVQLALVSGLEAKLSVTPHIIPDTGWYDPDLGVTFSVPSGSAPLAVVMFYRAYLTAADTEPVDALIRALRERGFRAMGMFAPSLKQPDAAQWIRQALCDNHVAVIINATAFSARGENGTSPLDATGYPVFQVALSTARQEDWAAAERGLSPADLAMHVVLPEVDGRIFAGVISFKAVETRDPDLQFSRLVHRSDAERIVAVAERVTAWHRLAATPAADQKLAIVLSTYPGRPDQLAHAVGLDGLASTDAILKDLQHAGYTVFPTEQPLGLALQHCRQKWPLEAYHAALITLPSELQDALKHTWGEAHNDPLVQDGCFHFSAVQQGNALVALQPERGIAHLRDADYHDLTRIPRHSYVAFYLWLQMQGLHALVHMGAHGTLEWLPGKAVALSATCWPEALIGALPVIYPFIVNDPGEAAQAKRRIGAVTLGHLPPPQHISAVPEGLLRLERLLDEYSTAEGLDPARRDRLISAIRAEAQASGVEQDLGLAEKAGAAEAIVRIDRFVCDIKESQFGDGLHIYGHGAGERDGLLKALAGRQVAPGPAGSPQRGRSDVLPTGRNLYAVDPRGVPSRVAHGQGVRLAEELLRRHLQDHGDWPHGLIVDLWGSATMRTAGEEFAMALHLAGLAPQWDAGSERVSGFEILPPALLGRPRIDVTLRVSGLFRDVFPGLAQMFEAATAALAKRDEPAAENPYSVRGPRIFGPRPGSYGLGMGEALENYSDEGRDAAGEAWLTASEWTIAANGDMHQDRGALEKRLSQTDSVVHVQDLPETDLLLSSDYVAHEAGPVAAMARIGGTTPTSYHMDTTRPDTPRARLLREEIARVVRARAGNPGWANGMMRHGFRGAAEITATLDNLAAFAHLTRDVPAHLFDIYYQATLGRDDIVAFMGQENPGALVALRQRFSSLAEAGLWNTRSNAIAANLHGPA
ncbi:cobalamin biosynthesis protein CobN [Acetobacter tropicalis NRIC 0312]|uniref:Cobaltochelatase subunit CobN n=1 Tax=Acetobacter tropicalis TaxID=104102 RepID=A0A511FQW2_9PROT|nr:cobaltochelatase subunit CobN [Acetobacter tropicalis]KXV50996.1 cobalamin biosynthesis protein CobN [Acetobacter tropicalis]GAL99065.1 cobaltochelatase subunit CobN [Acetobacter tropicalis]GBR69650.1 cobalamin biosynthesis protein CobN [Acetobacter tropicalis NRIC 0312]GEL51341.1 cobaltochelatase subunit CobN [Acetobacter tropicalis]